MPLINHCKVNCPSRVAEAVLYRRNALRPTNFQKLAAEMRAKWMGAVLGIHASYICPQRENTAAWRPGETCASYAGALIMDHAPHLDWDRLYEHEQKILQPYWPQSTEK